MKCVNTEEICLTQRTIIFQVRKYGIKDPLKMQETPMEFNGIQYEKCADSRCHIATTFKKLACEGLAQNQRRKSTSI
jgi:hypothetical protein